MEIELKKIKIEELVKGYMDNAEQGVVAFDGKLDVRPPYQREFVYDDKKRNAVIDTITKGYPLNVMYWALKENGEYEIIDGQQRTISICEFLEANFSIQNLFELKETRNFDNLKGDEKEKILNYELTVYICSGTDSEKLEWFKTINIAGEKLTDQELRNAVYSGTWVTSAKKYFSKSGGPAYSLGSDYLTGSANRQEYLETAIRWISKAKNDKDIELYMSQHQQEQNAAELWLYFQNVITWVKHVFPKYRGKEMKGVAWGDLYNEFKNKKLDPEKLETEVLELMKDDEVTKRSGIYTYVLTRNKKHLNLRSFSDNQKRKAYEKQKGICPKCEEHFEYEGMEGDHIIPWHKGGKTTDANCQMLCKYDNATKSGN